MLNPARPVTHGKRKRIFIALVSAIVVSLAANGIESAVIRLVRPSEQALTWVSDLVITVVLAVAVYLRLDLQATRIRLSRVEQEQIVVDTELSLAAEIQSSHLPRRLRLVLGSLGQPACVRQERLVEISMTLFKSIPRSGS